MSAPRAQGKWSKETPQETTRLLADSQRISRENAEMGDETMEEITAQGEILSQTREYVNEILGFSKTADASIQTMHQKAFRRKFYLWLIMIGLFFANIFVMAVLYQHNGKFFGPRNTK